MIRHHNITANSSVIPSNAGVSTLSFSTITKQAGKTKTPKR